MIIALLNDAHRFQFLIDDFEQQNFDLLIFNSVADLQRWLELNPEPSGLLIEFTTAEFQDFLIRFSLRYPETPIFSLKEQDREQLILRSKTFSKRLLNRDEQSNLGNILLVDDSRTVQIQYGKVLRSAGYTVETASDAAEGLEKALTNRYDLAIIDYFMPGDTGAQLCTKLQRHEATYDLVCAILTAQYKQEVVDECLNSGAQECMFKNESYDLLLTRVSALLRGVERKRQIEKERERLIGLLYSVAEGVYGVNADGRIQFVNPSTLRLLGYSVADLIGRFPHDTIHPIDSGGQQTSFDHCFLQQAYMLGDELREWRTLFQRIDGSLFPVECSVTRLGDAEYNTGTVVVFRDISEQQRLENNWQWQLNHDQLTGLLNRKAFEEVLNREFNRVRRTKETALLLFIDLDKFKIINDELGHAAGDALLVSLAEGLKHSARDYDHIGRLAGDEFVVLLTHVSVDEMSDLAERYRQMLEETNLNWEGENYIVTGSIGVSVLDCNSVSIGDVMANADTACHQAKIKGRNQWAVYQKESTSQEEHGNWFKRLTDAMKSQQFTLLQQPIFDVNDEAKIVGSNCFLRLKEGTMLISPTIFMSNAKRFGVIKEIDLMVLNMLIQHCQKLDNKTAQWFSLTLSVETMSDDQFLDNLLDAWASADMAPENLCLEVGEEELFNFPQWKNHLAQIRTKGFKVIISHFGMNSQSLLSLPQLPVDCIKLDTALTRELSTSQPRCNLIDAIVKTAQQNQVKVIATHIESANDLELLRARSVDEVQGFYLRKPAVLQ